MRHALVLLALIVAVALAACQDYQFNPVGHCLVQPGRASVASVAAIDVLFVVDDSLSMDTVQARLASNFETFIDRIAQKQQARVAAGKEPFDIHIAVTSTSVLVNRYIESNGSCGRVSANMCSIDTLTTPPNNRAAYHYSCTTGPCADIVNNYYNFIGNNCAQGVLKANGDPYPAGAFLAAGSNPKVISFKRDLNWSSGTADATIQGLIAKFKQNIQVGSCGANQEMPFEAARLAIQKAIANQQGLAAGQAWPHPGSELAVIFVGNEDDCSTRRADQGGLVWNGGQAGADSCADDTKLAASEQKLTPNSDYVSFLTGLGHPLVAAFVRPGFSDCNGSGGPGTRMHALATALGGAGATVIEASVCGAFGDPLQQIADGLAPPDAITLPTTPAADVVTRLFVKGLDGKTDHICDGPDASKEWWFVDCSGAAPLASGRTSACVQVARGGACQPTAGQTLVAEYLGRIPADGCATADDCKSALGGQTSDWSCEGASSAQRGTCVCAGK